MGPCVPLLGFAAVIIIRLNLSGQRLRMRGTLERDCEALNGSGMTYKGRTLMRQTYPGWLINEDHPVTGLDRKEVWREETCTAFAWEDGVCRLNWWGSV